MESIRLLTSSCFVPVDESLHDVMYVDPPRHTYIQPPILYPCSIQRTLFFLLLYSVATYVCTRYGTSKGTATGEHRRLLPTKPEHTYYAKRVLGLVTPSKTFYRDVGRILGQSFIHSFTGNFIRSSDKGYVKLRRLERAQV